MRPERVKDVGVALNGKIKTPAAIDTGLPDIPSLIVFFSTKGRVAEVLNQKRNLPVKGFLDLGRGEVVGACKSWGAPDAH